MFFGQQQGTGMRVTKLLIQDTGTYNVQWRRPYHTMATEREISMFAERLHDTHTVTAPAIAGVAGQFIQPSAIPEKQLEIPGGWGERRMRFMMEVVNTDMHGNTLTEVVLGYTDYMGISHAGSLDPQMRFIINSIVKVRSVRQQTPLGLADYTSVKDNSHVLFQDSWSGVLSPNQDVRMRPADVFMTMSRSHLPEQGTIADSRVMQSNMATFSRRENGLPTQYVAKVLQSYNTAVLDESLGSGEQEILSQAKGYAIEESAQRDNFLVAMAQIQGTPPSNSFTYRELMQLQPDVDQIAHVVLMGPTEKMQVHQQGLTADWGGADQDTVVATSLSNAVPALMMELALTKIAFMSTNRNIGGQITTFIANSESFSNIDQSQSLELFTQKLEAVILSDITMNNEIDFALKMQVDLLGETWINLSFSGKAPVDYVTPSFSDALMVPVLTQNQGVSLQLAKDFEALTAVLGQAQPRGPSFPTGQFKPTF